MKILVAGGTGWLGTALTHALARDGHEIVVLARRQGPVSPNYRTVLWDGRGQGAWSREVLDADAVVNFAGAGIADRRWSPARKVELLTSRVDPTRALVTAMQEDGRSRTLVCASGIGYYGDCGEHECIETDAVGNDFLASLVADWEAAAQIAPDSGVRVVQLRFGMVLGANGGALERLVVPFRCFVGGPIDNGRQWVSWIHIDDVVGLCQFAIANPAARGPMNAVAPHPVRNRELAAEIGRALGRPSWLPVPALALRLVFGELAIALLASQRVLPHTVQGLGYGFIYPDLGAALNAILGQNAANPAERAA